MTVFLGLLLLLWLATTESLQAPKIGTVKAGPIEISALGCGTWSWGNRLLWDYDPSQDEEIYQAYSTVRDAGVTVFDTADSYGTLELNGRAEILLGQFERRYLSDIDSQEKPFWDVFAPKPRPQQVATKFAPYPWRLTRGSVVQAARDSLKRLEQGQSGNCSTALVNVKVSATTGECSLGRHC